MNELITVFTPTYNRAHTLERCYKSLKKQSFKNFEWLIYDDGSTDNTKEIVEEFIDENILNIRFFYSRNAGKHVAINRGTDLANGELFFIVDSDDYLADNALNIIKEVWESIPRNEKRNFVGIGGKKKLINDNKNNDFNFINKYYDADSIKFNLLDKNIQDKAEIYVTSILKKYKFVEYENENFMTEVVVWYKLAEDGYKIRWFNEDIYFCEYLDDGLSANAYRRRIQSINSTCYSYNILSSFNLPIKYKARYKINYFRYGLNEFSFKILKKKLHDKKLANICALFGFLLKIKDNKIIR